MTLIVFALFIFKYYDFFRVSFQTLLAEIGVASSLPVLDILLPIGLSFYTLRAIAYMIDVYRTETLPLSFLDHAIYISFFPHLFSGPIARPRDFVPQLHNGGAKTIGNIHHAMARIISGMLKKVTIATVLASRIADPIFSLPENGSTITVLLAFYAYMVVIYCDFSGYTDMAIGIAELMGFSSPENFRTPYAASSLKDFWNRWHMSFSYWLRDYVYIPLGGNRKGQARTSVNSFMTMLVSGLWHGVGGTYLVWGALHGFGIALHQFLPKKIPKKLAWIFTFHFIGFTWIFFASRTFSHALIFLQKLFYWERVSFTATLSSLILVLLAFTFLALENRARALFIRIQTALPLLGQIAFAVMLIIVILQLGPTIVPPFIYFQF